jgi:cytochrome bd ubiquinol oxidase subunit I
MDTLTAARWQMTLSLVFHMIFAAIGIGLPLLMVLVERRWLKTGQEHYLLLAKKWAKATGLLFAVGAVSGTALSFELGLLWPKYMEVMGAVVGHIFGLEGFAFFIEAIFIGVYLYAWDKISPKAHWWSGVIIAISGAASGILVLGVNSWMQQPVGFALDEATGRVLVTDPMAAFKRYGWFVMALHSTLSCYIAVSFAVAGIYAWGWLKGHRDAYHRSAIRVAMAVGAISAILQPISGDLLAKFVYHTQPAKFAAMEGQFETQAGAPLRIGGWPNLETGQTDYAIEVPKMLSFLANWDFGQVVKGLNDIPRDRWPNVHLTHLAFQLMVAFGVLLMLVGIAFWVLRRKDPDGSLATRWMAPALLVCAPLGFIALELGWIVTEVGRQPWVIQPNLEPGVMYRGMLIKDAVTTAPGVAQVFYLFTALYILLGATVVLILYSLRHQKLPTAPQEVPAMSR